MNNRLATFSYTLCCGSYLINVYNDLMAYADRDLNARHTKLTEKNVNELSVVNIFISGDIN